MRRYFPLLLLCAAASVSAQPINQIARRIQGFTATPATCFFSTGVADIGVNTTTGVMYVCTAINVWTPVGSTTFPLAAPDGSAAAPSYSFTNYPSTGMYAAAGPSLLFAQNGVQALGIAGTQQVTFANPFVITGTGGAGQFLKQSSLSGAITVATAAASELSNGTSGSGAIALVNSPTFITPALGTPASGVATNLTGTAAGLTAGNVTTNANLTGPITSVGNATSIASQTGTGTKFVVDTSPTLVTPNIGVATATTVNKVAITAPATGSTLTIADGKTVTHNATTTFAGTDGKTFTINATLTLAGTDGTTMTFPTTSATLARTDAANTFTGHQTIEGVTSTGATGTGNFVFATSPTLTTPTIGAATATTINGNTLTTGTWTLTGAAAKTLTFNNALTLAGTDSTTMTFPSTSATIARTDAANTFTGHQTLEGVTSTGATGTGQFVFDTSPTIATPIATTSIQIGGANSATPAAGTVQGTSSRAGTDTNTAGAKLTIQPGNGTGNSTPAVVEVDTFTAAASGTGAQTAKDSLQICNTAASCSTTAPIYLSGNQIGTGSGTGANFGIAVNSTTQQYVFSAAAFQPQSSTAVDLGTTSKFFGRVIALAQIVSVAAKTANYTVTTTDYVVTCDATAGNVTLTLPAAAGTTIGQMYRFKKIDSSVNTCTVSRAGSDTIDGASTTVLSTQWQSVDIVGLTATTWGIF